MSASLLMGGASIDTFSWKKFVTQIVLCEVARCNPRRMHNGITVKGAKEMKRLFGVLTLAAGLALGSLTMAQAADKKPNILIIWGDDIGGFNVSAYNMGMMGYKTPNIDRIAKEGALFTDWYG